MTGAGIHDTLIDVVRTHIGDSADPRDRTILAMLDFCDVAAVEVIVRELKPDFQHRHWKTLAQLGWHP